MQVVPLVEEHVPAVAGLRIALLQETGGTLPDSERHALEQANEAFYRQSLLSANWHTWVALFGNEVGATGTLALWRRPPYPGNPIGLDGYILNMYTRPAYRGQGAAKAIVQAMLQRAKELRVPKLVLHATEAGRPIYAKAGFVASSAYMEFVTTQGNA